MAHAEAWADDEVRLHGTINKDLLAILQRNSLPKPIVMRLVTLNYTDVVKFSSLYPDLAATQAEAPRQLGFAKTPQELRDPDSKWHKKTTFT